MMMSTTSARVKQSSANAINLKMKQQQQQQQQMHKHQNEGVRQETRMVKLRQNSPETKLGFSLRGGKEATGSSVGVFVSHVESCGEAHRKGLKLGDQLVRVNGLDVDRATYDEVIAIIKRAAPKRGDILLEVRGGNMIPFQESTGQPIKWLQIVGSRKEDDFDYEEDNSSQDCSSTSSSISASDEGVDSCESNEPHNWTMMTALDDDDDDETLVRRQQPRTTTTITNTTTKTTTTSSLSDSGGCCSISISSLSSSGEVAAAAGAAVCRHEQELSCSQDDQEDTVEDELEIRVPGGQKTRESFGCGVVKGPDEWPGIFVQNVKQGSLAERVGLEAGDQLLEADGSQLGQLDFESAIQLIKRLQQQQPELVLLVRKGAALRHLARQTSAISSSISNSGTLSSAATATTWNAKELKTSGAAPPIKPRVCSKSSSEDDEDDCDGDDDDVHAEATRSRRRNPISGTQNQPTKRMAPLKDNNNNSIAAAAAAAAKDDANADANANVDDDDATTQHGSANHLLMSPSSSSSTTRWSCLEKQEASQTKTTTTARKMEAAAGKSSVLSIDKCRGCRSGSGNNLTPVDQRESDGDEEEDDVERIRIVSQNCKLHSQRRHALKQSSAVVREKFPQLASGELKLRPQTKQQTATSEQTTRMVANNEKTTPSRTSLKNRYLAASQQQHRTAARSTGMQRYVSMDNLCQQPLPLPAAAPAPASNQQRLLISTSQRNYAAHYARPQVPPQQQQLHHGQLDLVGAEQRFARLQQYNRRRSNSVLSQPNHQCLLECCHQLQRPARQLPVSSDCCSRSRRALANWPPVAPLSPVINYTNQTLANCQLPPRRVGLNYRAQSVDKLSQAHLNGSPINNCGYLRRYVGRGTHTTMHPPTTTTTISTASASKLQRRLQLNSRDCQQCSQMAQPQSSCNSSSYTRMISPQISSNSCSSRLLTKRTSISHLNLQEESIYLTCCPASAAPLPSCCCSYQRQQHKSRRHQQHKSSSHSTTGDSSGYLSSGSVCAHPLAAPAIHLRQQRQSRQPTKQRSMAAPPPPPPMITMEMARVTQQQQQKRETRIQCLSTFVSGVGVGGTGCQPARSKPLSSSGSNSSHASSKQPIGTSSAESDFSSFSPNNSLSSPTSSIHPITSSSTSDSSLLSNASHHQDHISSLSAAGAQAAPPAVASRLSPPRPPPLPLPDPEFDFRISTLKQQQSPSTSLTATTTTSAASTTGSKRTSESDPKQQLDRLCFVDELKMLAQRGQSPSETTSTLFKTLKATKQAKQQHQQQQKQTSCACCTSKPSSRSACRLHDQQQPAKKNDKLNEEDNKRRQHEMLMKEFKSAHSRMFNKRRISTVQTESPGELVSSTTTTGNASTAAAAAAAADLPAVNNRNYSPRMGAVTVTATLVAGNAPAMATKSANNNSNGAKKGSISAVSSAQPATAN